MSISNIRIMGMLHNDLSIAFSTFTRCMLTLLSVDEMLLPRYMKGSTDFRGLLLKVEIVPFSLKLIHIYF